MTDLNLIINPCQISSFDSPTVIDPIQYTLGDSSFDFGSYEFVQSPSCSYTESVSVSGLPNFVTLETDTQFFKVASTEDLS